MANTSTRRRRTYSRTGFYRMARGQASAVIGRAADESLDDEELTDVEVLVRDLRNDLVGDLGGIANITTAQRILVDSICSSTLIMSVVDGYLISELGGSMIDRRRRALRRVVADRNGLVSTLTRLIRTRLMSQ